MKWILICAVLFASIVMASDNITIIVHPMHGGVTMPYTRYDYIYNFSANLNCTPATFSHTSNITTDAWGVGVVSINLSTISVPPKYICEYRNGSLRKAFRVGTGLFDRVIGKNITTNWTTITGMPAGFSDDIDNGNSTLQVRTAVRNQFTNDTWNTTLHIRSATRNLFVNDTYNTSAQLRAAMNISKFFIIKTNWSNLLSIPRNSTFDQALNTTNNVAFSSVYVGNEINASFLYGNFGGGFDMRGNPWLLTGRNLEVSKNITASWFLGKLNASYVQNAPGNTSSQVRAVTKNSYVNKSGDTMTGNLNMGSNKIGFGGITTPRYFLDTNSTASGTVTNFEGLNLDLVFRIGNSGSTSGYQWSYNGTGSGDANYLILRSENLTTNKSFEILKVHHQNNKIEFLKGRINLTQGTITAKTNFCVGATCLTTVNNWTTRAQSRIAVSNMFVNTTNNWTTSSQVRAATTTSYLNKTSGGLVQGNINMTNKNLTSVGCIYFQNGGKICQSN